MTAHETDMRGPAIRAIAMGASWGQAARQFQVAPETVEAWWLAYEHRCGEIGRVAALAELGVADAS